MNIRTAGNLLVCAAVLFTGCAASIAQKIIDEPYQHKNISVSLNITKIEVGDARTTVDTAALTIPSFAFKTERDTVVPPLTVMEKNEITGEIGRYAKGGDTKVTVRATVKEGIKQYAKGIMSGREYVRAVVAITLLDSIHQPDLFSTSGEAEYEITSTGADVSSLENLYVKALKTCVYKAFESIDEFLEKRQK